MKKAAKGLCLLLISIVILGGFLQPVQSYAFTSQVIEHGSMGNDVIELQARLQYIGFYKGKIDGVFGWGTYWALRNFQKKYGLKVDGLAGKTTKVKLASVTHFNRAYVMKNINQGKNFTYYGGSKQNNQGKQQAQAPKKNTGQQQAAPSQKNASHPSIQHLPSGYSQSDINMMSNAVFGESRGEPFEGQVAVAAVILNRVNSTKFPNTVSGVIFQPGAFTAVSDGQIWLTPNHKAKQAVLDAINGWDPSYGALYYFNPKKATSKWIYTRPEIDKIGNHIFLK